MKKMISSFGCAILLLCGGALAYKSYQVKIPNGDLVAHPCKNNSLWEGVGHKLETGGGARNPFGEDFAKNGRKWTVKLCQLDSDGDGRTNGQELGDPNCTWSDGNTPEITEGITHPGVCEPYDADVCKGKNDFLSCKQGVIESCQKIKNNDTKVLELRFPETQVPNLETNYFCMNFDLPNDQDYHIKAFDAIKDNENVLHHILLYGCDPRRTRGPADSKAGSCKMSGGNYGCNELIGLWAFGADGTCFDEDIGFRFGKSGTTRVKLELHWNNPMLIANFKDSSGMKIWYQPAKKGVQDMGTFWTGQALLKIPPLTITTEINASCPSGCTQALIQKPIKVARAVNHMHYLGKSMKIEVLRDGKLVTQLTNEAVYTYDNPQIKVIEPHFEILPGDEIRTQCVFNSENSDRWTYYGEATNDEMCFGFLMVYPYSRAVMPYGTKCISYGPLSPCGVHYQTPIDKCNWKVFTDPRSLEMEPMLQELNKNCNFDGFCRPECHNISKTIIEHPCMNGRAAHFVHDRLSRSPTGLKFLGRVNSCRHVVMKKPPPEQTKCPAAYVGDDAISSRNQSVALTILMVGLAALMITY